MFALYKASTRETDLWVTLADFTLKNAKLSREICILLKIGFVETEFAVEDIKSYISSVCAKEFSDSNFTIFQEIAPNFQ